MRQAFKVLCWHNDKRRFSIHEKAYHIALELYKSDLIWPKSMKYFPHRWTIPACGFGPLCAFDTYEHAKNYVNDLSSEIKNLCEIYPCAVEEYTGKPVLYDFTGDQTSFMPTGTILCSRIRLNSSEPIKEGWKCVRSGNRSWALLPGATLFYRYDSWTFPPSDGGPLAVFSTLESAKCFCRTFFPDSFGNSEGIKDCIYVPVSTYKRKELGWNCLWRKESGITHTRTNLPFGTILAERVMLIK